MPDETDTHFHPHKVTLLSPDDEQARLIGKAIASETAGKILSALSQGELTAMVLSEELAVPVSTIMYHLDNLIHAGLIEVGKTRYSVKGREMKVYRVVDQVLIVSSGKRDIKSVLTRYATLLSLPFGVAGVLALVGYFLPQWKLESYSLSKHSIEIAAPAQMNLVTFSTERAMESSPVPDAIHPLLASGSPEIFFPWGELAVGIVIGAILVLIAGYGINSIRKK